jgi:hypothetical protein
MGCSKQEFLYPRSRYHGPVSPKNLVFNSNLQEFAQKVSYISGLHTGGKLSSDEALRQINQLWNELKRSKEQLGIRES